MCVLGIKLRLSGLVASNLAILQAPSLPCPTFLKVGSPHSAAQADPKSHYDLKLVGNPFGIHGHLCACTHPPTGCTVVKMRNVPIDSGISTVDTWLVMLFGEVLGCAALLEEAYH